MDIRQNESLRPYNTFGIEAKAAYFAEIRNVVELKQLLSSEKFKNMPRMFLGGGSNILLTGDYNGLVVRINIQGIEKEHQNGETLVYAGAGVIWHHLVMYCIDHGLHGLENLSLIPGTVGAAPMQNIGAYGVELKETFHSLEALDVETLKTRWFSAAECQFGYRESIFKRGAKNKYVICQVVFKLHERPEFNTSYGAIKETLDRKGVKEISARAVSDAVIEIRQSKLPDPAKIGNAGSFFKNPEIGVQEYEKLKSSFPGIPGYPLPENRVKVPAGWLIEQCGWKGKKAGEAGVHKDQALVLVNYGGAKGKEIWDLAMQVQQSVKDKFGITLSPEVNII